MKTAKGNLFEGEPASLICNFIANRLQVKTVSNVDAWWLGGIATGKGGATSLGATGLKVGPSKSDLVLKIKHSKGEELIGISVKKCNKKNPTNAQIFFTTATAFCNAISNRIAKVPKHAVEALAMFCGDTGFTPLDLRMKTTSRDRFYWEELNLKSQQWWSQFITTYQSEITSFLLQYAYESDPIPPTFIVHQRTKALVKDNVPLAIYQMEEFIEFSKQSGGFNTKPYRVLKGSSKNPNKWHEAPRFGFIQFQRGGQRQHPTQLQFNLKAGYFNSHL